MFHMLKSWPSRAIRVAGLAGLYMLAMLLAPIQANASADIRIGGTGSSLGGMQLLAKAFMETHSDIKVDVLPSLGSGGGIKALLAGKISFSTSSRPLKDTERAQGLVISEYAKTPLIFATRMDTATDEITLDQITAFYAGQNNTWSDGSKMRLIMRPANDTDISLLRGFSPEMEKAVLVALKRPDYHVALNDQDNISSLATIPGSLGMTTLGQVLTEKRKIKPLTLDGLKPTASILMNADYPYFKSLHVVTLPDSSPQVEEFLSFLQSKKGRDILESTGHIVIN